MNPGISKVQHHLNLKNLTISPIHASSVHCCITVVDNLGQAEETTEHCHQRCICHILGLSRRDSVQHWGSVLHWSFHLVHVTWKNVASPKTFFIETWHLAGQALAVLQRCFQKGYEGYWDWHRVLEGACYQQPEMEKFFDWASETWGRKTASTEENQQTYRKRMLQLQQH